MFYFRHPLFAFAVIGLFSLIGFSTKSVAAEAADVRKTVRVQKGDSLEEIAKRHGSANVLRKADSLEDYYLTISQTLNIVTPYVVVKGDQLDKIAEKYNTTQFAINNINHLESDQLKPGMILSIPVNSNRFIEQLEDSKAVSASVQTKKGNQKEEKKTFKAKSKQSKSKQEKRSSQKIASSGKQTIIMRASAYNVEGNEKWGRLTASGTTVRHGVVAVDPNVIPLGTKLYISGYRSPLLPKGGFVAVAEDTGGAIKGNRIDIFIDAPTDVLMDFGLQNVKVTILK